jgi:hypothetical protein
MVDRLKDKVALVVGAGSIGPGRELRKWQVRRPTALAALLKGHGPDIVR